MKPFKFFYWRRYGDIEKELFEEMNCYCDKVLAIIGLFVFSESEKGLHYWWDIYEKYIK